MYMPQSRGVWWLADFRADAVLLYREYEAGTITKEEMWDSLAQKYPQFGLPHMRTLRGWAHGDWGDLPERRIRFSTSTS